MAGRTKVLFICTANAARSQMAEGLLRVKSGDLYEVFSAGTRQSRVSPYAIRVMQEIGIDISHHRSKTLDEFTGTPMDIVVTLCDNARAVCPVFPHAKKTIHCGFSDPHAGMGSEEDILDGYRVTRDELSRWIDRTFGQE